MAKVIVGRDQQAEMRRLHPKPAYSRVIAQDMILATAAGGNNFLITSPVGNRVWLLSIDVWIQPWAIGGLVCLWFQFKTGQTDRASMSDVVFRWETVIDVPAHVDKQMYHWGGPAHRRFELMKFYEGQGRRFAVTGQIYGASIDCWMSVTWQISEG